MTPENNRIAWVDCLKGIGILSVIFAHITGIKGVFIFSMPLFFINAGYLFHPQPIKSYIAKLTQRISVPYCVFLAFLSVLCFKSNVLAQGGGDFIRRNGVERRVGRLLVSVGTFSYACYFQFFRTVQASLIVVSSCAAYGNSRALR